jgi:magnesium transporter
MVKFYKKQLIKPPGLSPGTLVHYGEKKEEKVRITLYEYDDENFSFKEINNVEEILTEEKPNFVKWINIDGLHDIDVIKKIGDYYNLHPLLLEDILHTDQRPKAEDYDSYIYIVLKMLKYNDNSSEVNVEQVSIILGNNFVISFQESVGDVFNPVRERLKNHKGKIRTMKADYLCYALLDAIVDQYFVILEKLGEDLAFIEEELLVNPEPSTLQKIHKLKRELIFLRKSIWPVREVVSFLQKGFSALIKSTTAVFLRDVYDHTIQIIETLEEYRDIVSSLIDIYLSSISNKMNQIMKVLTIIATIFIPLTFIAGVYGMNFKYMPELEWHWGYFAVWAFMIVISVFMLIIFKKRGWL